MVTYTRLLLLGGAWPAPKETWSLVLHHTARVPPCGYLSCRHTHTSPPILCLEARHFFPSLVTSSERHYSLALDFPVLGLGCVLCASPSTLDSSSHYTVLTTYCGVRMIFLIFWMRRLRLREVQGLAVSCTAREGCAFLSSQLRFTQSACLTHSSAPFPFTLRTLKHLALHCCGWDGNSDLLPSMSVAVTTAPSCLSLVKK